MNTTSELEISLLPANIMWIIVLGGFRWAHMDGFIIIKSPHPTIRSNSSSQPGGWVALAPSSTFMHIPYGHVSDQGFPPKKKTIPISSWRADPTSLHPPTPRRRSPS